MVISAVSRAAGKILTKTGARKVVKKIRAPRGIKYSVAPLQRGSGPDKLYQDSWKTITDKRMKYDKSAKRLNITKASTDKATRDYDSYARDVDNYKQKQITEQKIVDAKLYKNAQGAYIPKELTSYMGNSPTATRFLHKKIQAEPGYKSKQFAQDSGLFPEVLPSTNIRIPDSKNLAKDDIAAIYEAGLRGIEPERVFWSKDKNAYYYHTKGQLYTNYDSFSTNWIPVNPRPTGPLRHFKDVKFIKPTTTDFGFGDGVPFLRRKSVVGADDDVTGIDIDRHTKGSKKGVNYWSDNPSESVRSMKYDTKAGEDKVVNTYGLRLPIKQKGLTNLMGDFFEYPGYALQAVKSKSKIGVGGDAPVRKSKPIKLNTSRGKGDKFVGNFLELPPDLSESYGIDYFFTKKFHKYNEHYATDAHTELSKAGIPAKTGLKYFKGKEGEVLYREDLRGMAFIKKSWPPLSDEYYYTAKAINPVYSGKLKSDERRLMKLVGGPLEIKPPIEVYSATTRRAVSVGTYRGLGFSARKAVQLTTTKTPKIHGKRKTTRAKTKVRVQYGGHKKLKKSEYWLDDDEMYRLTDDAYGFGFTLPHPTKLEKYAITGGVIGGAAYGVGQIKKKKKRQPKRTDMFGSTSTRKKGY